MGLIGYIKNKMFQRIVRDEIDKTLFGPTFSKEFGIKKLVIYEEQWELFGGSEMILKKNEHFYDMVNDLISGKVIFHNDYYMSDMIDLYQFILDNSLRSDNEIINRYLTNIKNYVINKIYEQTRKEFISILIMYYDMTFLDTIRYLPMTEIYINKYRYISKNLFGEVTIHDPEDEIRNITSRNISRVISEERKHFTDSCVCRFFDYKNEWKYLIKDSYFWNPDQNEHCDDIPKMFNIFRNVENYPDLNKMSHDERMDLMYNTIKYTKTKTKTKTKNKMI